MPATQQITDTIIQDAIANAVQNVCSTLLSAEARLVERVGVEAVETKPMLYQVMGNVGFVGEVNGIVYLCMSDAYATFAVGTILGMSAAEVEFNGPDVLKDAIGEVTNMTVGGFKNALCNIGFPCKLTLPTIVRGSSLKVAAVKGAARHVFRFECAGHVLIADIQLKAE
jgi:chemotaxis protein CheX